MLFLGRLFSSFEELQQSLNEYEECNFVKFSIKRSSKLNGQNVFYKHVNSKLVYNKIYFKCVKGGSFRRRGKGERNTRSLCIECPAEISFKLTKDGAFLEVTKMETVHNHEISKSLYDDLPQVRKLPQCDIKKIEELPKHDTRTIHQKIQENAGNVATLKDVLNTHQREKNSSIKAENSFTECEMSITNGVETETASGKASITEMPADEKSFSFAEFPNLENIRQLQATFAKERNWDQYHQPRNLLLALVGEVGELSEIFQWRGEVKEGLPGWTIKEKEHLSQELSDVLLYLVRLSEKCHIDLPTAVLEKMSLNDKKYPASKVYGSNKKYTEYVKKDDNS